MPKTKYNIETIERDGSFHHFVTRGKSKPFTSEEILGFFEGDTSSEDVFKVEGGLRRIFAQDLKLGLKHCSAKYGAPEDAVFKEAERLFPGQNLERIIGSQRR